MFSLWNKIQWNTIEKELGMQLQLTCLHIAACANENIYCDKNILKNYMECLVYTNV